MKKISESNIMTAIDCEKPYPPNCIQEISGCKILKTVTTWKIKKSAPQQQTVRKLHSFSIFNISPACIEHFDEINDTYCS